MTRLLGSPVIHMGIFCVCVTVAYATLTTGAIVSAVIAAGLTIVSMVGADNDATS